MIVLNNKVFRSVSNTNNGDVNGQTVFYYRQEGRNITAHYNGGVVQDGQLVGSITEDERLEFRYQHMNNRGEFMTGICTATPEILPDGRIRLYEKWQWTCGDYSKGESVVEEIQSVTAIEEK
jgi:hypothetical protein